MTLHVVYCPLCPAGMVRPLYTCASRKTALRVQMAHAERHPGHSANPKHVGRRLVLAMGSGFTLTPGKE